jgi:hypothetical protein
MHKHIKHAMDVLPSLALLLMLSVLVGVLLHFTLEAACQWLMQQEECLRKWQGMP